MDIINILAGAVFLLAGQKVFWLFIAGLGFLFGFEFSTVFFFGYEYWHKLVISVIFGLLGLVSALFLQSLAIILTGFIAGGYLFLSLWNFMGWKVGGWWWIFFLISGIITSVLLANFFSPFLILLTSFIGALLIIQFFPLVPVMKIIFFIVLCVIGILVQSSQYFNMKG